MVGLRISWAGGSAPANSDISKFTSPSNAGMEGEIVRSAVELSRQQVGGSEADHNCRPLGEQAGTRRDGERSWKDLVVPTPSGTIPSVFLWPDPA